MHARHGPSNRSGSLRVLPHDIILNYLFNIHFIMDLTDVSTKVDPENDEVFISGLPADVTEQEIAEFFGQIGIIKQVRLV